MDFLDTYKELCPKSAILFFKCLKQFGFGFDPPPPLDNVQIEADFFLGIASLSLIASLVGVEVVRVVVNVVIIMSASSGKVSGVVSGPESWKVCELEYSCHISSGQAICARVTITNAE